MYQLHNFYHITPLSIYGKKSDTIVGLSITSMQLLKGPIQHFVEIENKIPINKGVMNQINLNITDQDNKAINVGKILLELYIMMLSQNRG